MDSQLVILLLLYIGFIIPSFSINTIDSSDYSYKNAFSKIKEMVENKKPLSFKRSIFLTENAFNHDSLDYDIFCSAITSITVPCNQFISNRKYLQKRKNTLKNFSIYTYICDTINLTDSISILPFQYDFNDPFGKKDWSKMFVTKLIATGSGNCHSLAYLYKILAEEMGAKAYLALAPNHIYIKAYDDSVGWYNTELTSGTFPNDAWFSASNYVSTDAIRAGIYMDTLSLKQSVALCLYDLAKGYERKFGTEDGKFILQCLNLCLQHFPLCVPALVLKAETLKKQYDTFKDKNSQQAKTVYKEMEATYVKIAKLGYREMPEKMYLDWLASIKEAKYQNEKMKQTQK